MNNSNSLLRPLAVLLLGLLTLLGACSRKNLAEQLEIADKAFQNREFEKAKIEYINALRIDRTNALANLRLTKIFIAQGQIAEASRMLGWCRATFPQDLEIRALIVEILSHTGGETNRARLQTEIHELLDLDPANERGLLALAAASRTPEDITAATAKLADLKTKTGERPAHKLAEAELLRRRGDTNGCETAIKAAIALAPDQPSAYASYAGFLMSQRRTQEAETALRKAAELAPPYAPVRETWVRFLLASKRTDEARSALDDIIAKAPERVSAWVLRAELALSEKQTNDAERFLGRALGQAPSDTDALRLLAQLRVAQGKSDAAVREMEKVAQKQPGSAQSQYQLALAHLLNKDSTKAAAALQQSVQLNPNAPTPTLLLADLSINQRDYDGAAKLLREFIARSPQVEQAHLLLMRAEQGANRPQDALTVANEAFQRFPTNPAIAFQRGLLLRQFRNPTEARKSFDIAANLTTNNLLAVQQLAELDLEAGNATAAANRIQARLDRFPDDPSAWLLRSRLALVLRDQPTAESAARKAVQFAPNHAAPHLALARAHLAANRKTEAITSLDEALKHETNHLETIRLRGEIASADGDHAKARELFEAGVKAEPNDTFFLNNLAYLYAEVLGKAEEARQYALRAREINPKDPRITDTLGWIEYRRGLYPEALRLLAEAGSAPDAKDSPEIQYHLGMAHYMMGDEASAQTALQIAANSPTDFSGRNEARDYLAMLRVEPGKADEQALRALEKRTKEAPNDVLALTRLATAYESTGATDKARQAYDAALKVNSQSATLLAAYANFTHSQLNDPAKALDLAKRARTAAPNDPNVAWVLGRLALLNGDSPLAYSLLQEASRKLTQKPQATFDFARAAYAQGRIDDALNAARGATNAPDPALATAATTFAEMINLGRTSPLPPQAAQRIQAVLAAEPKHAPALFASGLLAEAQNQFPNARQAYEAVLAQFPNCSPALRQLAILCADHLADYAKARELGQKAREVFPRDDSLAAAYGKAVCRGGDFTFASQLLTPAARTRPNDASIHFHLGLAQRGLKQTNQAIASLEKALSLQATAPFAEEARQFLQELKSPAPAKN